MQRLRLSSRVLALALFALSVSASPQLAAAQPTAAEKSQPSWPRAKRDRAIDIMVEGSLNVSRTKKSGRRFLAPESVADRKISNLAEKNFRRAARFVADHAHELPLNKETAIQINRMVTRELVPESDRGDPHYRKKSSYSRVTDPMVRGDVERFYRWLSREGGELGKGDPVALAEKIHHNMSALDSFPDGNGRTARLMADLALLKHERAPALYTPMKDYFRRGNARSKVSREAKVSYFREIARRGQRRLERGSQQRARQSATKRHWLRRLRKGPKSRGATRSKRKRSAPVRRARTRPKARARAGKR